MASLTKHWIQLWSSEALANLELYNSPIIVKVGKHVNVHQSFYGVFIHKAQFLNQLTYLRPASPLKQHSAAKQTIKFNSKSWKTRQGLWWDQHKSSVPSIILHVHHDSFATNKIWTNRPISVPASVPDGSRPKQTWPITLWPVTP